MQKVKNHSYKECLQVVRSAAFYFATAEKKQIKLLLGQASALVYYAARRDVSRYENTAFNFYLAAVKEGLRQAEAALKLEARGTDRRLVLSFLAEALRLLVDRYEVRKC